MNEAILFYGLHVVPRAELGWDIDTWEDFYAAQMGLMPVPETASEWEMVRAADKQRELIDECPVSVLWSVPGEELIIAHKDSICRTGSKWIAPAGPPITLGWFGHLQRFCKVMGVRGKEPCWWLVLI